ncbi:thioesterase II family protein [Dyella flagellata]|uniref:Thioesterase n=1 Tax=Dyella flagellata TaxID=1867833 RepID=A0ABQ5X907_9GAMM|nr:alpha/beta fold hydrolase [Dyella flagellata]GLQ87762.1 thioesterase [Dyella flagellata]
MSAYKNPWFQLRSPAPNAALRLFCFPYAGGSASVFHDWPELLSHDVEVIAVQYPGRGYRFGEPLIASCANMVAAMVPSIVPWLSKPYAFFGHSNGGLLSFELALTLQRMGHPGPVHHFISGKSPVHLPRRRKPLHNLTEEAFIHELRNLGGTPREFIDDPELMRLFLPILRADFALGETYSYAWRGKRLKTAVSYLYGRQDESYAEGDEAAWSELIDGAVDSVGYDGGHFFIHSHKQDVIRYVDGKLRGCITAEKGRLRYA